MTERVAFGSDGPGWKCGEATLTEASKEAKKRKPGCQKETKREVETKREAQRRAAHDRYDRGRRFRRRAELQRTEFRWHMPQAPDLRSLPWVLFPTLPGPLRVPAGKPKAGEQTASRENWDEANVSTMRLWSLTRLTDEVTHGSQTALRQGDGLAALRAWSKLEALEGSSSGCHRQRSGTQDEA